MKKGNYLVLFMLAVVIGAISYSQTDFSVDTITYSPKTSSFLDGDVEYLIITVEEFEYQLEPLQLCKSQKGLNAKIVTVEEIELNPSYTGWDTAAKIKSCITDYYLNNGTEFVVLAGDYP